MKFDYITYLLLKASNTLTNECIQEIILQKLLLIESILYHNPDIDTKQLVDMSISEKEQILEYYETNLLEKYKKRKLTPVQFTKEKDGKLKDQLDMWQERLKQAKELGNKDKEEIAKDRVEQVKHLIDANKKRLEIEKEEDKLN